MIPKHPDYEDKFLTSWKDIAEYLGKGVRTAQRWERDLGLPIRRPSGLGRKNPVIALSQDLDDWLETWSSRSQPPSDRPIPIPTVNAELLALVKAKVGISRDLQSKQEALLRELTIAVNGLAENCNRMAATHSEHPVARMGSG